MFSAWTFNFVNKIIFKYFSYYILTNHILFVSLIIGANKLTSKIFDKIKIEVAIAVNNAIKDQFVESVYKQMRNFTSEWLAVYKFVKHNVISSQIKRYFLSDGIDAAWRREYKVVELFCVCIDQLVRIWIELSERAVATYWHCCIKDFSSFLAPPP